MMKSMFREGKPKSAFNTWASEAAAREEKPRRVIGVDMFFLIPFAIRL
jgi:hypothetical protein